MIDFNMLLEALYQIQGASDPNQPPETMQERLAEVFEMSSRLLEMSGWQPD